MSSVDLPRPRRRTWPSPGVAAVLMLIACPAALAAEAVVKLKLEAHPQARRFVLARAEVKPAPAQGALALRDAAGRPVPADFERREDGTLAVRWLVREVPAGEAPVFTLSPAGAGEAAAKLRLTISEAPGGTLVIRDAEREVARFQHGDMLKGLKHPKPFFYPIYAHGKSVTRAYPMEDKPNEAKDHPHHTGLYFVHGEVNGKDYWSKLPITPKRVSHTRAGSASVRIAAENAWGEDLLEAQRIDVLDAGQDVILDWEITLTAPPGKAVHLGKTKEGSFAFRLATGLTAPEPNARPRPNDPRGAAKMIDANGAVGEAAIRPERKPADWTPAPWADVTGAIDGTTIGVTIMNHPTSWRYPTDWHVRNYGLFAANPFMRVGEHHLRPGESVTLRYRVFVHGGTPAEAKVAEVFAGYAHAKVSVAAAE